ncbi:hypothetical protein [Candidatus Magnetobacterium casense]|uniref:Uncharacterized protein n=1 Tax=Candidatus Magnetobacterium casense TaxID=1455061 RepID=A0ABS6S358_9BACT|nr:hypothetical protein [Candidatus Magnetobacterium casensis]MBV6343294.1 hypothetical protein [Candidatus Magnetobacterium casensis]
MTHRLLVTFLVIFIGCSFLAAIMQGGGGIVSTLLTENVTANATVIPVVSTASFNNEDIIRLGNEKILHSSTNATAFIVAERGYDNTTADDFAAGSRVYSTEAGVLNDAFGYNLGVSIETGGTWGLIMVPINFFTTTLPHLIVLNANLFRQGTALAVIPIFWYAAGIALLVIVAKDLAPIAISAFSGIFGLIRR